MTSGNRRDEHSRETAFGSSVAIGVAIGAGLGAAFGDIAIGVALGAALGAAIPFVVPAGKSGRKVRDPSDHNDDLT